MTRPARAPGGRARALGGALRGLARLVGAASAIAFLGGFVVFALGIEREEAIPPLHAEGVVALTGGADRIGDAIDLLARGHADRLLITGVNRATRKAELARVAPAFQTLFDCCVDLGYEALNTSGNARETRAWARTHGITSLIVVTSNYHMPRALAEIAGALPQAELVPYPVVAERARGQSPWNDAQTARIVATEYVKYLVALARLGLLERAQGGPRVGAARWSAR